MEEETGTGDRKVELVGKMDGEPAVAGGLGVTLEELKNKMADFAMERDWDQFHSPRNLLLALVCTHEWISPYYIL